MPNLPISGLPQSTDLTGAEILPLVQSSTTKKGTAQDIRNIDSPLTASGITVSGDIIPTTPQAATLGTIDRPFKSIFLQSGSISIESDTPGDPSAIISNVDANLEVSVGGMRLVQPGNSFIAETGSFQFISGSLTQIGDYIRKGNTILTGSFISTGSQVLLGTSQITGSLDISGSFTINEYKTLATASILDSILTFTKTDNSTFEIQLPVYNASSGSNEDNLGGTATRTLYTRNSAVSFTTGSNVDFMSGSEGHTWGSRELPSSFLLNTNFVSKVIHFRTIGAFGSAGGSNNFNCYIQIGDDKLDSSDVGNVALSQPDNHPFEIVGELIFTGGECSVCYSLAHCANNGDLKRYPLSDTSSPDTVTGFSGGDIKLIINGSNVNPMTSYTSYIQIYN